MMPFGDDVRDEMIGRTLGGRYRLLEALGSGASATVYLADDLQLSRHVAVKVLHRGLADDPSFLRRFRAEAQAAAALSHQNILAVFDWGTDGPPGAGGLPYLVTEYLAGGSLRAMLDRGRQLTPSQALIVGLETARGLEYAHRRGFVHRDIKPANLLFGEDGRLRIADFGLARAIAEATWTEPAGVVLGTARYASPEQAKGNPVDGKTDVYSLALTLSEAVTGVVPFAGETTVATLMNRIDKLMPVSAELGHLASIIERAGRPDTADRSDAGELARALVRAAERLPRPTPLPLVRSSVSEADLRPIGRSGTGDKLADRSSDDRGGDVTAVVARTTIGPAVAGAGAGVALGGMGSPAASTHGLSTAPTLDPTTIGTPSATPPSASGLVVVGGQRVEAPAPGPAARSLTAGDGGADRRDVAGRPVVDRVGATPPGALAGPVPATVTVAASRADRDGPGAPGDLDDDGSALVRARQRRRLFWGLGLAVVAGLVGVAGVVWSMRGPTTYPVEAYVGQDAGTVENDVSRYHWTVVTTLEKTDDVDTGKVVRQTPPAGDRLAKGATVQLAVSDGPKLRGVPSIVKMPEADAVAALTAAGLTAKKAGDEFSEDVEVGKVLRWTVDGQALQDSAEVSKGKEVAYVLSSGPQPRQRPSLKDMTFDQAKATLEGVQLVADRQTDEYSDTVAAGLVIRATPPVGDPVARGNAVQVVMSLGPQMFPMPDLTGKTAEEANAALQLAGFTGAGKVSGTLGGKVVGQSVPAGQQVPRTTAVEVTLG